jgi:hypothetical protein
MGPCTSQASEVVTLRHNRPQALFCVTFSNLSQQELIIVTESLILIKNFNRTRSRPLGWYLPPLNHLLRNRQTMRHRNRLPSSSRLRQ